MLAHFFLLAILIVTSYGDKCKSQTTEDGAVCVCDSTYCDTVPDLDVSSGKYQIYSTSAATPGLNSRIASFIEKVTDEVNTTITVNPDTKYQTIIGFGGAFSDSTGININSLPSAAQEKLIESYFADNGIQYSFCRVPVGGTDFSTKGYSYDDVEGDVNLEHFALTEYDFNYKIPYIQRAQELTGNQLKLFSSVWTAPVWMKSNGDWPGVGWLKEEYYQLWAEYLLKFFDAYEAKGITFWGMTPQNEPIDGFFPPFFSKINAMGWVPSTMSKWIGENLGPSIRNSSYKDLKIILHDDNRAFEFEVEQLLSDPATLSYADGVAFHWYTDALLPSFTSADTFKKYKEDLFVISSEACNGYFARVGLEEPVNKGSWKRGAKYIDNIIKNLEVGTSAWVDWNMVLDEEGGPTYIDNFVDSPILVNSDLQEFYKQPMFYVLGHFSKFLRPGSVRLETKITGKADKLKALAFLRPDNLIALIVYNSQSSNTTVQIGKEGSKAIVDIEPKSLNTILYKHESTKK